MTACDLLGGADWLSGLAVCFVRAMFSWDFAVIVFQGVLPDEMKMCTIVWLAWFWNVGLLICTLSQKEYALCTHGMTKTIADPLHVQNSLMFSDGQILSRMSIQSSRQALNKCCPPLPKSCVLFTSHYRLINKKLKVSRLTCSFAMNTTTPFLGRRHRDLPVCSW